MRLILSRKGWDSAAGGAPSPILKDGELVSLPIPYRVGRTMVGVRHEPVGRLEPLVHDLSRGRLTNGRFHFDPDLVPAWHPRKDDWRPAFGQDSAAQRHLARRGVGVGDLFLFFGWFRRVETIGQRFAYARNAPDLHVLFGWLQIGDVIALPNTRRGAVSAVRKAGYPWLEDHPHVEFAARMGPSNTIYVAAPSVEIGGAALGVPGAGLFPRWHRELQLTEHGALRTVWSVPAWWAPGRVFARGLSYHDALWRWSGQAEHVRVQSARRGQEFVLDVGRHAPALRWTCDLLRRHGREDGGR